MSRVEIKTVTGLDRGLAYGECCFETVRVTDGAIFAWPDHWQRLQAGLATFGMALPNSDKKRLYTAILQTAAEQGADALVRLTISGGEAHWGLRPPEERQPQAYIQAMPVSPVFGTVRLQTVSWPFPLRPKLAKFASDYADTLRAMQMWQDQLEDGHEPLLTTAGAEPRLLSGITANLLLYRQGEWYTPVGDGILPGVVRGWLMAHAGVRESGCPQGWLQEVEAMALCNSGFFIRPVAAVDGHSLNTAHPALKQLYEAMVGQAGVPANIGESV